MIILRVRSGTSQASNIDWYWFTTAAISPRFVSDPKTILIKAINSEDVELFDACLSFKDKINVNDTDEYGNYSPIVCAAERYNRLLAGVVANVTIPGAIVPHQPRR